MTDSACEVVELEIFGQIRKKYRKISRLLFLKIGFTVRGLRNYSVRTFFVKNWLFAYTVHYVVSLRFPTAFVKKRNKLKHNSETNMYSIFKA